MESWNRLTAVRGEEGVGDCLKEDEGISQKSIFEEPLDMDNCVRTDCGSGGGLGGRGQRRKRIGTTVIA